MLGGIYASTDDYRREELWECLNSFAAEGLARLYIGDFNALLEAFEKRGGKFVEDKSVRDFFHFLFYNSLVYLGFSGPKYTWCKMKGGLARTWERLDRVVCSTDWLAMFPGTFVKDLSRVASDHCPLLLKTEGSVFTGPKPFHFERFWVEIQGSLEVVKNVWRADYRGSPTHIVADKSAKLKSAMRAWNKRDVGDFFSRTKQMELEVNELQAKEASYGFSGQEEVRLKWATSELHNLYRYQELLWRQKSRVQWLRSGDSNTQIFHRSTMIRRKKNLISEIRDKNGVTITSREGISDSFLQYFQERWAEHLIGKEIAI